MYRVTWKRETVAPAAPTEGVGETLEAFALAVPPEPVGSTAAPGAPEAVRPGGWAQVFIDSSEAAEALRRRLLESPGVLAAEIQGRPATPGRFGRAAPVDQPLLDAARDVARRRVHDTAPVAVAGGVAGQAVTTPDYSPTQHYLGPDGLDVAFALGRTGLRGEQIGLVDIEVGWNPRHEDLVGRGLGHVHGPSLDDDHGTAVAGIVGGEDNGLGVIGIASRVRIGTASIGNDPDHWDIPAAVIAARQELEAGDVLLLELQAGGQRWNGVTDVGMLPVEFWSTEFDEIRQTVDKGVYVVAAAGNGSQNLDDFFYQNRFDQSVRDSGVILVGAGASVFADHPRSRLDFSNFGSRLDVQGWGEAVVTSGGRSEPGYHDLSGPVAASLCYTRTFAGTSSAVAMVAGLVAVIASSVRAAGREVLTSAQMRALLIHSGAGREQRDGPAGPATERIGPLPSLREALRALGL